MKVHSRFQSAVNLDTPLGLVTLLAPGRCLQPYSIVLEESLVSDLLEPGALALGSGGIWRDGSLAVDFTGAPVVDLHLADGPVPVPAMAGAVRRFLASAPGYGLAGMALGRAEGPYASLLAPRLEVLRRLVRAADRTGAVAMVCRIAGCGPGLTPSSDDFLCGYLAMLPQRGIWADMTAAVACAAAARTNDISAALLRRAGEGLFSEDVLTLIACLRRGNEGPELAGSLLRVASFGSSSGYDFLTGVYFGVLDACAIGGICIGQT